MKISDLGTIMGIWAHPDDETYTMGGLLVIASRNGQKTICITATRGELGTQDEIRWPKSDLSKIRTNELEEALKVLGVDHHHWLDYSDGSCNSIDIEEATNKIADLINLYMPDTIITFGPDGMTGHEDHKTVSKWTTLAVEKSKVKAKIYHAITTIEGYQAFKKADESMNMYFNIDKPCMCRKDQCDLLVELNEEVLDKKILALRCMPSQTESVLNNFGQQIREGCQIESFVLEGSELETL